MAYSETTDVNWLYDMAEKIKKIPTEQIEYQFTELVEKRIAMGADVLTARRLSFREIYG